MPRVTVARAPAPRTVDERVLELQEGATVADALAACGITVDDPEGVAVWGRRAGPRQLLRDGDRIELSRPLKVDPKVARRERFRRQGSRAAGLFAARRPGSKPGY